MKIFTFQKREHHCSKVKKCQHDIVSISVRHTQIQQDFPEIGGMGVCAGGVAVQGEGYHILLNILKNSVLLATFTTGLIL